MTTTPRHKIFLSYYHDEDQWYKDYFLHFMRGGHRR